MIINPRDKKMIASLQRAKEEKNETEFKFPVLTDTIWVKTTSIDEVQNFMKDNGYRYIIYALLDMLKKINNLAYDLEQRGFVVHQFGHYTTDNEINEIKGYTNVSECLGHLCYLVERKASNCHMNCETGVAYVLPDVLEKHPYFLVMKLDITD